MSHKFVKRLEVKGLFGTFNHDLLLSDGDERNPNLMILYGENGTGKTTLLRLVYHLLNKENGKGHRTFLANSLFREVAVTFSDDSVLSAFRNKAIDGSFVLRFSAKQRTIAEFVYEVRNGVIPDMSENSAHHSFSRLLPTFNFGFLPHDRLSRLGDSQEYSNAQESKASILEQPSPVQRAINRAVSKARWQAIRASNEGQSTVNRIYSQIVNRLAVEKDPGRISGVDEKQRLLSLLQKQSEETNKYSSLGLISDLPVANFRDTIKELVPKKVYTVAQVLEPYLQGSSARLEALRPLYIAVTTFVETVNNLFLNKSIAFNIETGLKIRSEDGALLSPEVLSSGEKELLVMFCEVIGALGPETVLFIDEPEISLNVTWQRKLVDSLLGCASGSNVQFLIATHSVELLAKHRRNVVRLSNKRLRGGGHQMRKAELHG